MQAVLHPQTEDNSLFLDSAEFKDKAAALMFAAQIVQAAEMVWPGEQHAFEEREVPKSNLLKHTGGEEGGEADKTSGGHSLRNLKAIVGKEG